MSDESKIIEVKNYLELLFQGCEVVDMPNPLHAFAPRQFEVICDNECISTIWFGRSVWEDTSPAAFLSGQQLAELIKENPGKIAKVMEGGIRFDQK
jgi:hypothetical protein